VKPAKPTTPRAAARKPAAAKSAPSKTAPSKTAPSKTAPSKTAPSKGGKPTAAPKTLPPTAVAPKARKPKTAVPVRAVPREGGPKPVVPKPVVAKPAPPKASRLSPQDLREFRERLGKEYDRLAAVFGKLDMRTQRESSADLSAYSIHRANLGTDADEREKDLRLVSAEGRLQELIREALAKFDAGVFGLCELCEQPIDRRRLDVVPHAAFCLPCQERIERK